MEIPPERHFNKNIDLSETSDATVIEKAWKMLERYSQVCSGELGWISATEHRIFLKLVRPLQSNYLQERSGDVRGDAGTRAGTNPICGYRAFEQQIG